MNTGRLRDDRDRRRPGGPERRLPPRQAEQRVRHPRRERACRRRVAQPLGLASPLHAGSLQRATRDAVRGAEVVVPDEGRDGRLPRGLCGTLRVAGASRDAGRAGHAGGRPVRRVDGDERSRREMSSSRPAPSHPEASRRSPHSSTLGSSSSTPPSTATPRSCRTARCSWSGPGTPAPRSPTSLPGPISACWPGRPRARFRCRTAAAEAVWMFRAIRFFGHRVLRTDTRIGRRSARRSRRTARR